MKKSELNQMAKDCLTRAIAIAYYSLDEYGHPYGTLTEEEQKIVQERIDKYGKAMCKAIGEKYYTL